MKCNARARLARALLVAGALAGALLAAGCGKKPVATVNGLPITEEEFNDRCANLVLTQNPTGQAVSLMVLSTIIPLRIVEKELQRLNLVPSEADVDRRLALLKKQAAFMGQPLEERLKMEGRSEAAFRRDMRDAMLREAYQLKDVKVSEAEAKQFYDRNPDHQEWSMKERVRISQISVRSKEKLQKAMEELRSNANFATVAASLSEDPFQQMGGNVPRWFTRDDLKSPTGLPVPHPIVAKAFELQPGQYSDPPLKVSIDPRDPSQAAWVVVKLEEKKPAERLPFEEIKELVIQVARFERAQARPEGMAREFGNLVRDAQIEVNRPEWQEFVKQFRQMLAAQAGGGPAGPPGAAP